MSVQIELLTAPWCPRCASAGRELDRIVAELNDDALSFKVVDVLQALDYAVALGVVSTPAVAINGKLAFTTLPAAEVIRGKLLECLAAQGTRQ